MNDAKPPCTSGESHRFKMPPEQNAMPWEQEIIRLKQQLAEAQEARERALDYEFVNRALNADGKILIRFRELEAERDTLRGLLRGSVQVLQRIWQSSIEEHTCGRDDSPCRVCAITHLAEREVERITAALKEVG